MTSPSTDVVTRLRGEGLALRRDDLLPPDQPYKPYPPLHRWRYNAGLRALMFFGLAVGFSLLVGLLVGLVVAGTSGTDAIAAVATRWSGVIGIPAFLSAYLLLTTWIEQRRPPHELAPRRAGRGLLLGLGLGAVLQLLCVGLLAAFGAFRIHGVDASYNPVWALATAGFGAAINEEILFRGILFRLVEDTFGTWVSIVVSALVFGLAHLGNAEATLQGALAIALEAGVLFAVLYALTRSLWVLMGLHFAWNVIQGPLLGIVVSGSSEGGQGYLRSTLEGPAWLAGGGFGMEASVVTVAVLTALAVWLMVQLHRRGLAVAPFWVRRRAASTVDRTVGGAKTV